MATPVTVPSMTSVKRRSLVRPSGALVYDTDQRQLYVSDGVTPGGVKAVVTNGAPVFPEPPVFDEAEVIENTPTTYGVLYRQSGGTGNDGTFVRVGVQSSDAYYRIIMAPKGVNKMVSVTMAAGDARPTIFVEIAPKASNPEYPTFANGLVDSVQNLTLTPGAIMTNGIEITSSSLGLFGASPVGQRTISAANYAGLTAGTKDVADALIAYGLLVVV